MGRISEERRADVVYRLLYGETLMEIDDRQYVVVNPSPKIRVLANKFYRDAIYKNRFGSWLKDVDCLKILIGQGLCSPQIDSNLREMEKSIEDLKVDLYRSMFQQDKMKGVRKTLEMVRKKQDELISIRHMLDYTTLKGYAEMIRRQFLLFSTFLYYESNERVWADWDSVDMSLLEKAMGLFVNQIVSSDDIREISRTEPWRAIWSSSKGQPFSVPYDMLNEEQRAVILFSQMYDNLAKHPECPPDDILEDDDLLDGWLIIERRKREKSQMDKQMESRLGNRHLSADEVFVVPKGETKEDVIKDVQKIHGMNTTQSVIVKKQREKQLKARGKMVDAEFFDRKLQIQQEATEKFIQQVKGGRK